MKSERSDLPAPGLRDPWLASLCLARALLHLLFMTYAACLPVLRSEWDMSATAAGSIMTGFQAGYGVSLLVFSWAADRIGAKRTVLLSVALSAATSLAFALFARSYATALVLYTLVALSAGGAYAGAIMLIADRYPPAGRGAAMGWLIASTSLGYAASALVSGLALPWGGYPLAFLASAGGALLGGLLTWLALRATTNLVHRRREGVRFATAVLRNRRAMRLIAGYLAHNWELLGMWAWTPAFIAASLVVSGAADLRAVEIGAYIAAAFHLLGLAASSTMGQLSDRLGRRAVLLALAALAALCSFAFGWLVAWPIYIVVAVGAIYGFAALGDSPVLSTALTEAVHPAFLGAALGLRSILGFGAGALAPLAFGAVLDLTNPAGASPAVWGWAFAALGLGGLLATVCAYGLEPGKSPCHADDRPAS
ncbi:MAG: MFS transporter [Pseudomonadota bacterium]